MERLHVRPRNLTPEEAVKFDFKKSDRLRVIDPMTHRPLPDEGHSVVQSTYWVRRLNCGDVELVKPAARARARSRSSSGEN